MKNKIKKTIAFAYYSNEVFLGWYGGTFGTCAKIPKLYSDSKRQKKIIIDNFKYKLKSINETSFKEEKEKIITTLQAISLLRFDSENILKSKNIELRIVESPEYNGVNIFHSKAISKKLDENYIKLYHKWCKEFELDPGIEKGTNFGIALIYNYKLFASIYPKKSSVNWTYPNYDKVKEWASKEPTEFLGILVKYKFTKK